MVVDPAVTFPDTERVLARIRARTRSDVGAVLDARACAEALFGERSGMPVLRAAGLELKITLGRWLRPGFTTLRAMRRLRGTGLDPFGRAEVRRVERELVDEYLALLPRLAERAAADTGPGPDRAVEIAALPDMVRGYEQLKLDNVARYRERLTELTAGG